MPQGPALTREWAWGDVLDRKAPQWLHNEAPFWMLDAEIEWRDPFEPIEYRGRIARGHEDDARKFLFPELYDESTGDQA